MVLVVICHKSVCSGGSNWRCSEEWSSLKAIAFGRSALILELSYFSAKMKKLLIVVAGGMVLGGSYLFLSFSDNVPP
jgi:hypothetical protein